ncbi:reverse transcriptase zinc-binding domain-containing protein [Tanacetum coccineum]
MGSNEEIRRLAQEAEKQQLFAQKVQQQNMTLTSQLEMYKERVRILEVRDRDIIRDLEKQRDKLELDVKDYKRQKEEYQKTQKIFNQTQCNKEEKYLDDILQLQAKIKDFENVVCKMGKSTETLRLLTNEQKALRDNLRKSGLGYNGPYVLSQAYAKIPKLYNAYELCNKSEQLHVFNSEETLEDAEKSQLKMNEFQKDEKVQELKIQPIDYGKLNKLYDNFVPQKELSAKQTYFPSSCISFVSKISSEEFSSKTKPSMASMPSANPMLVDLNEMENIFQMLFELIQKILENDLDETFKQNELLKDRLLEGSLAEDIKNLVITSCVEIRNKDLHDEIERISKESNGHLTLKSSLEEKGKFVRQPREERKSSRKRDDKKGKSDRTCFRCGDPCHLIGDCPKISRNKDQKDFIGGSMSDAENDADRQNQR